MKKFTIFFVCILLLFSPFLVSAETLNNRLKGRILLQVESAGEAWYIHPTTAERYYMANGEEAYNIMRRLGIGISDVNLEKLKNNKNEALKNKGKIFLQVEAHGEAYYVDFNGKLNYLKNGEEAYNIMRNLGLGITNNDLEKIVINNRKKDVSDSSTSETNIKDINNLINKNILDSNNLIFSYSQLKSSNLSYIEDKKIEMNKFPDYYQYQTSAKQLIDEVENENYLIEKLINIHNNIINEFKLLINTGQKSSENINKLIEQSNNIYEKIKNVDNKIKNLIEQNVKDLNDSAIADYNEKEDLLNKMEDCNNSIKDMTQKILDLKSNYYEQVELIRKKPISSYSVNNQIEILRYNTNLEIDKINNQIGQKKLDCSVYFTN